jgi:hypothetical protein
MSVYVDREGNEIDEARMIELQQTKGYGGVLNTVVPAGYWVSTVWIGYNRHLGAKPAVFETKVFMNNEDLSAALDLERYMTEADAVEGHWRMVLKWGGQRE